MTRDLTFLGRSDASVKTGGKLVLSVRPLFGRSVLRSRTPVRAATFQRFSLLNGQFLLALRSSLIQRIEIAKTQKPHARKKRVVKSRDAGILRERESLEATKNCWKLRYLTIPDRQRKRTASVSNCKHSNASRELDGMRNAVDANVKRVAIDFGPLYLLRGTVVADFLLPGQVLLRREDQSPEAPNEKRSFEQSTPEGSTSEAICTT